MKQERAVYLQAALEDERRQFQQEAEDDKQRLHSALEATIDKEKKLLEEVENQRWKAMAFQRQLHETQVQHAEWKRETKAKMSELVAKLKQDFMTETQAMDEKYAYVVELLRNARDDIVELSTRNEELEKKIHDMICWEKTW
ncbi:hypothetical protein FI667_g10520, partial [Globisporangium splendens]